MNVTGEMRDYILSLMPHADLDFSDIEIDENVLL